MKDFNGVLEYKNREYKLVFNLNSMEVIQEEYGNLDNFFELLDGSKNAKENYKAQKGSYKGWDKLTDLEKALYNDEPNIKAIKFGYFAMLNEGIEIDNDEKNEDIKPFTLKQIGRIVSEIGLNDALGTIRETIIESTESDDEKNE